MKQEVVKRIISENSTPCYIFDLDQLEKNARALRKRLGKARLCYAMKANPFLIKPLENIIDKYEVCSPGELKICKEKKIDMSKIVLSGVNKEIKDINNALEWGVKVYTVESKLHLKIIQEMASKYAKKVDVLLRLTSGNQFGMGWAEITEIIQNRNDYKGVEIIGLQYYSGTQKKTKKIIEEAQFLCDKCKILNQEYGFLVKELEYGPGFLIDYFGQSKMDGDICEECCKVFRQIEEMGIDLTLEMGRFLVADCGCYITKVMDIKENEEQRFCIVDGGIHHVNYHGQVMGVRIPPIEYYKVSQDYSKVNLRELADSDICVCGSLCTVADVLVRNIPLDIPEIGDVLIFYKMGAYSVTEGIYLFLSRCMPKIYFMKDENLTLVRDFIETYQLNC